MFQLIFDAALIGIIIAAVERSEFPGWGPMIGCVLAIGITSNVAAHFLPEQISLLGYVAGAVLGAFLIAWLCETTLKRGALAAGIYLAVRLLLALVFDF